VIALTTGQGEISIRPRPIQIEIQSRLLMSWRAFSVRKMRKIPKLRRASPAMWR